MNMNQICMNARNYPGTIRNGCSAYVTFPEAQHCLPVSTPSSPGFTKVTIGSGRLAAVTYFSVRYASTR